MMNIALAAGAHAALRDTIFVHADGRTIDLFNPQPADIDLGVMCEHLAKEPRYSGATPDVVYSVAEHLSRGALAVYDGVRTEGQPTTEPWPKVTARAKLAAAYFILHDFHEAYFRDETTPKKRALDKVAETEFGVLSGTVRAAYKRLIERMDRAIAAAAGLAWPQPDDIAALVHRYDQIMLNTEWRDLMPVPHPWLIMPGEEPLAGVTIKPWGWRQAREQLRADCRRWLPACKGWSS